ncbi:UDP-forming cellulose synthase catalytic subunit [Gluconacetobacter entanii]|uniref:Cellulose synthase n=1 Tax=Gluconacetobacter entanii TaxID=108528 RepID=A0ABT3K5I6_9PROT|nr:UDP-forming cellulose synthase catalytic subunit [Gluconacetobacter entanii]MCW4590684.1 UDP-forming cellulose synthase catalytic subunit [Gluconacetobacter entanii]MCW4593233.1 UDP-forming cellulose synthase catalytic subunit [Gluconacetobacter entanii]NPC90592.1 UDP-forming cellulose synthase catalytic subunit [Gluconacetobacter entanii]
MMYRDILKRLRLEQFVNSPIVSTFSPFVMIAVGVFLMLMVGGVTMSTNSQALVSCGTLLLFFVLKGRKGRGITCFLMMLSLLVSLRYMVWRLTTTLELHSPLQAVLSLLLVLAELYALMTLCLSYFQMSWPLDRKPLPLPPDTADWPVVDVYVPSYNEELSLVRSTVLGALAIDWPEDKLNVYILDDGRRKSFHAFAMEAGAGYIIRDQNNHAKAGNLNHALRVTEGEYVVIFDCDHIPTRGFLKKTIGWMMADPKLALLQTPHHFYSPDPFQRNLASGQHVPPEGNMFYGLVQDGNDFWDATFFCGSCAAIRRSAVLGIGGFATETVTEDAHTALKMQREGWHTAYLREPLAAGLSTERLMLHIGQRVRWARGMLQIMRLDNPLLGPGLHWQQRLCYLSAMSHFLFAIPRLIFLASPLAFLFLGQNIIAASPYAILVYAFPHVFHSIATLSRVEGRWRYSFWSEIYETTLALFLVRVTIMTLLNPRKGEFNVTDKGGLLQNEYFDLNAVYPNVILAGILAVALVRGIGGMLWEYHDRLALQSFALNTLWVAVSLIIVLASIAVGRETRQIRHKPRVRANLPITLVDEEGHHYHAHTSDISLGGIAARLSTEHALPTQTRITMLYQDRKDGIDVRIPALILFSKPGTLHLQWCVDDLEVERQIVEFMFGRCDAWANWADFQPDRPLRSFLMVLRSIGGLFRRGQKLFRWQAPQEAPLEEAEHVKEEKLEKKSLVLKPVRRGARRGATASLLVLMGLSAASAPSLAQAPSPATPAPGGQAEVPTVPTAPPPPTQPPLQPPPGTLPTAPQLAPASAGEQVPPATAVQLPAGPATQQLRARLSERTGVSPAAPFGDTNTGALPADASAPPIDPADAARVADGEITRTSTFRDLGLATGPLTLRGFSPLQGLDVIVPANRVVTRARITLTGALSPSLLPEASAVSVTLNEQYVGTIRVDPEHPRFGPVSFDIDPLYFTGDNKLNFHFAGEYRRDCNDLYNEVLWARISDLSTVTLTTTRIAPDRKLSYLPAPFYDPNLRTPLRVPVVMPNPDAHGMLKASALVASWFGKLADFRTASFPVSTTIPASGNAVAIGENLPIDTRGTRPTGPTLSEVENPNDRLGTILVITGRNAQEVEVAARVLAFSPDTLGAVATKVVDDVTLQPRRPYDAPAFVPTDRPVRFGELVAASDLQGGGFAPPVMALPFHLPPDLYSWRNRPYPIDLWVRTPGGPVVDLETSRLDVHLNNNYLDSFTLKPPSLWQAWSERLVNQHAGAVEHAAALPSWLLFGQNQLKFSFDARPIDRGVCRRTPDDIHMSVDSDSWMDFRRGYHFARLPNLSYFAEAAFPFSRMADLSETTVVVPHHLDVGTAGTFMDLMGFFGSTTWYPASGVQVEDVSELADHPPQGDIVVLATAGDAPKFAELLARSPYELSDGHIRVGQHMGLQGIWYLFQDHDHAGLQDGVQANLNAPIAGAGVLIGAQSPYRSDRSVVALMGDTPGRMHDLVMGLRSKADVPRIQGDLVLRNGDRLTSYRTAPTFTMGSLPWWMWLDWYLGTRPLTLYVLGLVGAGLVASAAVRLLRRRARRRLEEGNQIKDTPDAGH